MISCDSPEKLDLDIGQGGRGRQNLRDRNRIEARNGVGQNSKLHLVGAEYDDPVEVGERLIRNLKKLSEIYHGDDPPVYVDHAEHEGRCARNGSEVVEHADLLHDVGIDSVPLPREPELDNIDLLDMGFLPAGILRQPAGAFPQEREVLLVVDRVHVGFCLAHSVIASMMVIILPAVIPSDCSIGSS